MAKLKDEAFHLYDETGRLRTITLPISANTEGIFIIELNDELYDQGIKLYKSMEHERNEYLRWNVGYYKKRGKECKAVFGNNLEECKEFVLKTMKSLYSSTKVRSKVLLYMMTYSNASCRSGDGGYYNVSDLQLRVEAVCCEKTVTSNELGSRETFEFHCEDKSDLEDEVWTGINAFGASTFFRSYMGRDKTISRYSNVNEIPYTARTGVFFFKLLTAFDAMITNVDSFFKESASIADRIERGALPLLQAYSPHEYDDSDSLALEEKG